MANLRFGKGIRVKAAQAHVCLNLDVVQRIVLDFSIVYSWQQKNSTWNLNGGKLYLRGGPFNHSFSVILGR